MLDRVPKYPGRVKLVPVEGQANVFDLVRADEPTQVGTPLNKATLLKDLTAQLFGLGETAVPDDVLAFLGKYNLHWWNRREVSGRYEQVVTAITNGTHRWLFNESYGIVYSYSDSVSISTTGVVSLGGTVKTFTAANVSEFNTNSAVLVGRYFTASKEVLSVNNSEVCLAVGAVYYIPSGATFSTYSDGQYTSVTALSEITSEYTDEIGEWEHLQSSNRNAYPDSGESDGYEWKYLGVPFENAVNAAKFATGSYVGTGGYGKANAISLTLPFIPKTILLYEGLITSGPINVGGGSRPMNGVVLINAERLTSEYSRIYLFNQISDGYITQAKIDDTTFTFYASNLAYMFNASGVEYFYIALS